MDSASLPILLLSTPALRKALGPDLRKVAVLAVQAMLRHRRGVEIAHQQIGYRKHTIAFSSRIGRMGDLILELDVGKPGLDRLVLEQDLRKAEAEAARGRARGGGRR